MYRLVYAIPSWILFLILYFALTLIGHLIIPILLLLRLYKPHYSWRYQQHYIGFTPRWLFYPFSNEGDGLYPPEYRLRFSRWSHFRLAWTWTVVRNPVNNLRFIKFLRCDIDPARVGWISNPAGAPPEFFEPKNKNVYWFFCWCGMYSGFRRQYRDYHGRLVEFWIGWKIWPSDSREVSTYRQHGAGFALQWRNMDGPLPRK